MAELAHALSPHADVSSRVSVDRIAGTLGNKAKCRSQAEVQARVNGNMTAATTVKSGETRRTQSGPMLMGAVAAILVASAAILGVLALVRARGSAQEHEVQPVVETGNAPGTAAGPLAPPERDAIAPLVVPAEVTATSPGPSSPSANRPTAPVATPVPPGRLLPCPPSATASAAPAPSGTKPVIDTTVDTRR